MIIVFGERRYGAVGKLLSTALSTRWFHLWGVPVVPLRSLLEVGDGSTITIPLVPRSLLVTALRVWPLWAAPGLAFVWERPAFLVGAGAAYVATLAASFRVARTTRIERAQRLAFAEVVRAPIDPALLASTDVTIRRTLEHALRALAPTVTAEGYRATPPTWQDAVRSGAVAHRDFLLLAVTFARFERGGAPAEMRAEWASLEALAWERLVAVDPSVLTRADAASPELPPACALLLDDAFVAPSAAPPTPVVAAPPSATPVLRNSVQHRVVGAAMVLVGVGMAWASTSSKDVADRWMLALFGPILAGVGLLLAVVGEPRDERGAVVAWHKRAIAMAAAAGLVAGVAYAAIR